MKNRLILALSLVSLVAACAPAHDQQAKNVPAKDVAFSNVEQCKAQASSRLSLFDRPSTYPISAAEKSNAYSALYSECMKTYEVQATGPKPNFDLAQATNAAGLANLSPAAGGNSAAKSAATTLPNGVVVIDMAQFANLSPAAGGGVAGVANGVSGNGSTVVVVQAPPSTSISYPPAPTQPSAIPVTPTAAAQAAPAASEPAPRPHKTARAKAKPLEQDSKTVTYRPSRFERNAVPLAGLQPSAGSTLEKALITNPPEPKD